MKRLLVVALVAVITLLPAAATAKQSVTLTGRVVNGTDGASVPTGFEVVAVGFTEDGELGRTRARTKPNGTFSLSLPASEGARYIVAGTYHGVTYSAPLEEGKEESPIQLEIFEVTEDDTVITVAVDLMTVVKGERDELEVVQQIQVQNDAKRTYIGQDRGGLRQVVRLPVPTGAFGLTVVEGFDKERAQPIGGGIATGEPLLPGTSKFTFIYKVRVPASGWALNRNVFYSTSKAHLLVEDPLTFAADGFKFAEEVDLEGKPYRRHESTSFLAAGDDISGAIRLGGVSEGTPILLYGIIAGGVVIAVLAIVVPLTLRRRRGYRPPKADRKSLVRELAEWDEAFAAGRVDSAEYVRRRDQLKRTLADISDEHKPV